MIDPPNGAAAYPADYLAFLAAHPAGLKFDGAELFPEPADPASRIPGKQGCDNFAWCVLIGLIPGAAPLGYDFKILLSHDHHGPRGTMAWHYRIADRSEFDAAAEFPGMTELVDFLARSAWRGRFRTRGDQ